MPQCCRHSHFAGKDAVEHVAEAQAGGLVDAVEEHGLDSPSAFASACDAARDTALLLFILSALLQPAFLPTAKEPLLLAIIALSWALWKAGRSALLGWHRLERLHRLLQQEQWEIEHHRQQEREELSALYQAKGFQGELLEEVLDVLMANGDRLLKVMVEEELGLKLNAHPHPLQCAVGASTGALAASLLLIPIILYGTTMLALAVTLILLATTALFNARSTGNNPLSAIVWQLATAALPIALLYSAVQLIRPLTGSL